MKVKRTPVLIRIKDEIHDKIKQEADNMGVSVNAYISMILAEKIAS